MPGDADHHDHDGGCVERAEPDGKGAFREQVGLAARERWRVRSALLAVVCAVAGPASAAIEEDTRCLSTAGEQRVQLEWHTFSDDTAGWFGGYVRYRGQTKAIPIVLASTRTTSRPAGRPWEFRYVWLEVLDGVVSGEYALSSQGASVYGFSYRNRRTGARTSFSQVDAPGAAGRCDWG